MLFAGAGSRVYVTLCGFNIIFADYDVERVQELGARTMVLRVHTMSALMSPAKLGSFQE
jgi:hypothetical protein